MGKINVYTLGQFGINRVSSPIQVKDGELLAAQNATVKPYKGQLALKKRDGMRTINSVAAAGTLSSINNIPLGSLGNGAVCTTGITDNTWEAGAWSPALTLFAVVGRSGTGDRVITSPDGIVWTTRTSAADISWNDIVWSPELSLFVAVGGIDGTAAQQVMTSPDGVVWTSRTASSDRAWNGVAWSPALTLFAAVTNDGPAAGQVMTSPDGTTWTARTASTLRGWRKICWSPGLALFVAVGATLTVTNDIMTSPDGINWTTRDPGINLNLYDIAWSPELERLVAVGLPEGAVTTNILYSDDGITWTAVSSSSVFSDWLGSVAWSPELGVFIAGYNSVDAVAVSSDGENWQKIATNCSEASINDVVYAPALEQFLLIGEDSAGDSVMEMFGTS